MKNKKNDRQNRITPSDDIVKRPSKSQIQRRFEVASHIRSMADEIELGSISSLELRWDGKDEITFCVDSTAGTITIKVEVD